MSRMYVTARITKYAIFGLLGDLATSFAETLRLACLFISYDQGSGILCNNFRFY